MPKKIKLIFQNPKSKFNKLKQIYGYNINSTKIYLKIFRLKDKYTISYHFYGIKNPQNHIDFFLDFGKESESLIAYKSFGGKDRVHTPLITQKNQSSWEMHLNKPHRKIYMNYQGKISGNRGKVRILRQGFICFPKNLKKKPPLKIKLVLNSDSN